METGSPRQDSAEQKVTELLTLAGLMLERADEITDTVMTRVYEQLPVYTGMVPRELLRRSVHDHVVSAFDPMARNQKADLRAAAPAGRVGAADGIPLTVVMDGYRVSFRVVWSAIVETARVARGILAGLDELTVQDRDLLLDTFGAWLDADGSAGEAGRKLFVHPNTVRNRLRRLEKQTGRSLSNPRAIAELILAYEIDCGTRGGAEETAAADDR